MKKLFIVSFCVMLMFGCVLIDVLIEIKVFFYFFFELGIKLLIVDDVFFLMFVGEFYNFIVGSVYKLEKVWLEMVLLLFNILLLFVFWELIELEEGVFDFIVVDSMIKNVCEYDLKLVLLWFGSWKNGKLIYVLVWVKEDFKRFFLVIN